MIYCTRIETLKALEMLDLLHTIFKFQILGKLISFIMEKLFQGTVLLKLQWK